MKHKEGIITTAIDLYFKNVSLRKIKSHLKQVHEVEVSHVTILNWVRKYSVIIKKFTDKMKINGSDTVMADEMMVNIKGDWTWFWSVMDKRTKFITSTHLSEARNLSDAIKLFKDTKKRMKNKPKNIVTDGLNAYIKAIRKNFWRHPQSKHIRLIRFWDKVNNNPIERYHGTIRERTKVMRGFKEMNSANTILHGFINYYNFIRPHCALNGLTPAQVSGINLPLNGGNRWLELIKLAIDNENDGSLVEEKSMLPSKTRCIVRIFDQEGNELDGKEEGYKTEFESREKAEKWVEFYKQLNPNYIFKVEKNE
jgi:transposase-like protein